LTVTAIRRRERSGKDLNFRFAWTMCVEVVSEIAL